MRDGQGSRTADRVAARRAAHRLLDTPLVLDDPLALRILDPAIAARLQDRPEEFNSSRWGRSCLITPHRPLNAAYLSGRADGLRVGEMVHVVKAVV